MTRGAELVTVFVSNIPPRMHWQGLWATFARHGEVVDSFIPSKRSRAGSRFGFVRFSNTTDAHRAISRLDGFFLMGYRISVSLARFNPRINFWKKSPVKSQQENEVKASRSRSIVGHVENEELWKWKRKGDMVWGRGFPSGKTYLLTIDDEDLFIMLEDANWSYLTEIFEEVTPWSESVTQVERATWLEISGLPLHCWNHLTIKRIAELWGTFEASGENANHTKDCEKVSVLISTDYERRIEELVKVEVGEIIHRVRVLEIGFSDDSTMDFQVKKNEGLNVDKSLVVESSPDSSRNGSSELDRKSASHVMDEAVKDIFVGKVVTEHLSSAETSRQLGEHEMMGGVNSAEVFITANQSNGEDRTNSLNREMEACGDKVVEAEIMGGVYKDEIETALQWQTRGCDRQGEIISWDEITYVFGDNIVDKNLNLETANNGNALWERGSDGENEKDLACGRNRSDEESNPDNAGGEFDLPEFHSSYKAPSRRAKRYRSLFELQDKALTDLERRKRDRTKKRVKNKGKENEISELEGRSLTDADMQARRDVLLTEAKKTLAVGKSLGIVIIGDEEAAVEELVLLAERDLQNK
ncbi:hypothetical protein GQ457_02G017040 [Hibiscus cannabinus]